MYVKSVLFTKIVKFYRND